MAKAKRKATDDDDDDKPTSALPEWMVKASTVKTESMLWGWEGRILRNTSNLIDGNKGLGKSTVMASIAIALSHGKKLPGERKGGPVGNVFWMGSEEQANVHIIPRWKANGGDTKRLHVIDPRKMNAQNRILLPQDVERLIRTLILGECRVLVIDPFSCFAHEQLDMNSPLQARRYMEAINDASAAASVTTLMARHFGKGSHQNRLNAGLGSVSIAAVARVCLRVDPHPVKPETQLLTVAAGNYGKRVMPIAYTLAEAPGHVARIAWGATQEYTLEEIIDGASEAGEIGVKHDARTLLLKALKNGPVEVSSLVKEGAAAGLTVSQLQYARDKLGVVSKRKSDGNGGGGAWRWQLPEQ